MAKKKDELQFGQVPLPQALKQYSLSKLNWSGLNRRQVIDTGALSMECNISTNEAPYLTPSQSRFDVVSDYNLVTKDNNSEEVVGYKHPISLFTFDNFLVVIYREKESIKIDYLILNTKGKIKEVHTGLIKTGVQTKEQKEKEDNTQRSMVQFNVYENSVDVLDGTYVKKLLLFPDKVSMFMKIVNTDRKPQEMYDEAQKKGETIDIDVMYCYQESSTSKKEYYVWQDRKFVKSGGNGHFAPASLDVRIEKYYNDGYVQTKDEYYNDGYRKSSRQTYNDGYKKVEYNKSGGKARFYDGYDKVNSGTYKDGETYYERQGACSPYTYIVVTDLEEGDDVTGLYQRAISSLKQMTNVAFYERTGTSFPYTYIRVYAELDYGSDISNYYEKVSDGASTVQTKLYVRKADDNGTIIPYEYEEVTEIEYGTDISDYYEKISDKEVTAKAYYKRTDNTDNEDSSSNKKYQYELVKNLENGKKVSKYYEFTDSYAPPLDSDKGCYWFNTYDEKTYQFCSDTGDGKSGFGITVPPSFPNLKYAVVHLSRLFGVDEDRVHVSGYNDYSNWNLDTVEESNESNAWSSASQTNSKAGGNFVGISVYDNHVVCFKRDFMHEIYNSKNPFRLVDVYAEGSIDNRSIQEVNGKLIFASEDEIKVYTGSQPREIGYNLGIDEFASAVSGSDGRNYYLYCTDKRGNDYFFVYDTMVNQWSQQAIDSEVLGFAHNQYGMYMLCKNGFIYKMDTGDYKDDWSCETDLSTILTSSSSSTYQTVNIKHISKFQMLAYIKGRFKVYALYDDEEFNPETSQLLYDSNGRTGMQAIRLKPRMTANYGYKLHFEGHGYVRFYQMELAITPGGELFASSR